MLFDFGLFVLLLVGGIPAGIFTFGGIPAGILNAGGIPAWEIDGMPEGRLVNGRAGKSIDCASAAAISSCDTSPLVNSLTEVPISRAASLLQKYTSDQHKHQQQPILNRRF